jgi:F-type H+-transporting ATPase subunit b
MQEIMQQLGNLLLGAVPTMLLFIVLVAAYQLLVQGPLTATLKERRARTEGAVEEAHRAMERAESKATEYAETLRQARAEVFKLREQRLKQRTAEKDAVLSAAHQKTGDKVRQTKAELESEVAEARKAIQAAAGELAKQVERAVLPAAAGGSR